MKSVAIVLSALFCIVSVTYAQTDTPALIKSISVLPYADTNGKTIIAYDTYVYTIDIPFDTDLPQRTEYIGRVERDTGFVEIELPDTSIIHPKMVRIPAIALYVVFIERDYSYFRRYTYGCGGLSDHMFICNYDDETAKKLLSYPYNDSVFIHKISGFSYTFNLPAIHS